MALVLNVESLSLCDIGVEYKVIEFMWHWY